MKLLIMALALLVSCSAAAVDPVSASKEPTPVTDEQAFKALNIIAVPIGQQGMVVKDSTGCLWVLKNTPTAPVLAAVMGEQKPLCEVADKEG